MPHKVWYLTGSLWRQGAGIVWCRPSAGESLRSSPRVSPRGLSPWASFHGFSGKGPQRERAEWEDGSSLQPTIRSHAASLPPPWSHRRVLSPNPPLHRVMTRSRRSCVIASLLLLDNANHYSTFLQPPMPSEMELWIPDSSFWSPVLIHYMPICSVFIFQIETILASFKDKLTYQGLSFLIFKMGFICDPFKKIKRYNELIYKTEINSQRKQTYDYQRSKG